MPEKITNLREALEVGISEAMMSERSLDAMAKAAEHNLCTTYTVTVARGKIEGFIVTVNHKTHYAEKQIRFFADLER